MLVPVPTKVSTPRRSTRIPTDILIELHDERFAYAGQAITANLHGALIRIAAPLKLGDRVTIHVQSAGKSAEAIIVFADNEQSQIGLELESPQNIWGVDMPPSDWVTS